jgi:hypothetical protein
MEDGVESDIGAGIRYDGQVGQGGKPGSDRAMATKDVETNAEFGSTEEECNERHAIRPTKGQGTSMRVEGPRKTDGDGQMTRMGGKREKDDDDESWHDAREEGWETAA